MTFTSAANAQTTGKPYIPDSLVSLASIKGADMTYYTLYSENLAQDKAKAMTYSEKFLTNTDSTAVHPVIARMATELSEYLAYDHFLYSKGIYWRERALGIYRELGDKAKAAETEFQLAVLYLYLEQYHKTLLHTTEALKYYSKAGYNDNLYECYNLLGIVYSICGDMEKSDYYFDQYIMGAKQIKDSLKMINAFHNLIIANPSDSIRNNDLIEESIRLCKKFGDTATLTKLYLNFSATFIDNEDYTKAGQFLEDALPLLEKSDDTGSYYKQNGIIQYHLGNMEEAIKFLRLALDQYRDGELYSNRQECLTMLQNIYSQKGDYTNAYKCIKEYYDIDKKINTENVFLELFKTESDIKRLTEQEELTKQRNRMTIILLGGILSFMIIVMVVIILLRKKSYQIKEEKTKVENENKILELKRLQQFQMKKMTEEISGQLAAMARETKENNTKTRIQAMCSEIGKFQNDAQWSHIDKLVPEFNSDFYQKLVKDYPELTVNERRLCALLNLNLSTKEISEITRQTPHSINVARSRLRAKLKISGDNQSIQEFLSKYN